MEPGPLIRQLRMDSSSSSCSNRTRSIASLGGSDDSILEEQPPYRGQRPGTSRQLSDGFSPDEQDSGFNSTSQLESPPNNGGLRCRTPEKRSLRGQEDGDEVWLPRFPRARRLGGDRMLGTSGSLGSTDSWIENSVSEEEEEVDDADMARCLTSMTMGSGVIKVKGSGRCAVKTLYLDGNKTCVRWRPSKKGNKAKINIESIKELREGPNTDTFKKYLATGNKCPPKICFSIIHGSSWDTFDLISDTEEEMTLWVKGLKHLLKGVRSEGRRVNNSKLRDCWLKATFEAADKSGDGLLSMDEVLKLLHKLNVNLNKRKVKQLFKEADSQDDNVGKLDFDEFNHFYRTISTRQEVDLLLRDYGHSKGYLTLEEFAHFLTEEQAVGDVELELCNELVQTYEPIPENSKNGWLGIDGFTRFLLSHEGDIFNPAHREVNQDMTQPLTHYFIASSHNTYLVGDQLMSQSSVDVYALVLQAGCRCVEMDCWDGKDGEPIIYHGYTLTSKIKFRDVISIISKYAFVTSPYPVILSIENHCSLEQQKKMALYLVEILGEMLHVPSSDPNRTTLPSPEELKGKILIKAKKLPQDHNENLEAGEVSEEDSADELDDNLKLERSSVTKKFESVAMAQLMLMRKKPISPTRSAWQRIVSKVREDSREKDGNSRNHGRSSSLTGTLRRLKLSKKKPKSQSSSESSEGGSLDLLEKSATDEETSGDQSTVGYPRTPSPQPTPSRHKGKSIVLCRQLSQLVQFTRSVGFRGFKPDMASWELPSLGEIRASNLVATKAPDFTQFTTNHLCRVYPSAYRIDSSNYNPQPMWNCGCQLVALNYQTEGRPMQLSRAKFSQNGNTGYVLKHPLLCDESKPFDPNSGDPVPHLPKKQLTLHIISGQQLPKPPQSLLGERGEIIDPYVEVEVIGLAVDCAKSQTRTVQDNGFNPFWDCTMTFTLHLPEMALIRFAVWDEDPIGRDFIGQAAFPVSSLMSGYRHVHLAGLDQATLFVHVTLEDYNTWMNNTARFKPRGSQCRTKSVELEYSPLSSSPTHRQSPRRKSSLGLVQKLNMRRRHSMAALPPRELSPLPTNTRIKRRSYEDGNITSSAGELSPGEHLSECYFELALNCTDTAVNLILDSLIPSVLEVDGTICISVDDLPDVLALDIPCPTIFEAVREQKLSLKSEESYTAVERYCMLGMLMQEEMTHDLQKCETESVGSSMSYEQFVQDVFEDCFGPELSYDPCPDLLKEASPSLDGGKDSVGTPISEDTQTLQDRSSNETQSSSCSADSCFDGVSESQSVNRSREGSDDGSDEVFLPGESKQAEPCERSPIKEPTSQKPQPIVIPNPSSSSSPSDSPLISPTSPQHCTFTRDTVERRSRIIYDDTAEFLTSCLDTKDIKVGKMLDSLDQKFFDTMSISSTLFHEYDSMLDKYQKETQCSMNHDDSIADCKDDQTKLMNNHVTSSNHCTSETKSHDVINKSLRTISQLSMAEAKSSLSDDSESFDSRNDSDMLSVSCDEVISDISGTDYESDTSSDLPRCAPQLMKVSRCPTSGERDAETTGQDKLKSIDAVQIKTNPKSLQVSARLASNSCSNSHLSAFDFEDMKLEEINGHLEKQFVETTPVSINDRNNNKKIVSQLKEQDKCEGKSANLQASLQCEENSSRIDVAVKADRAVKQQVIGSSDVKMNSADTDGNREEFDEENEDPDETLSSASSSSIASSTSSNDTVVEVSSFVSMPSGIPSLPVTDSLSPLKLDDIFDPSECQQFRSELVQRWQKNNHDDDSIGKPSSHFCDKLPSKESKPTYAKNVDGPKPYSPMVQTASSDVKFRQPSSAQLSGDSGGKRLSWPLRSAGNKNIFTERVFEWDREDASRTDSQEGSSGRSLESGMKTNLLKAAAQDETSRKKEDWLIDSTTPPETQPGKNGLHHPSHPGLVYRSQLAQVRLSNENRSAPTSLTTSSPHMPPSYHDHTRAYKKSHSAPSSLTRSSREKFPKRPPSYEDHVSKYGLPSKFRTSHQTTDSSKQASPSIQLWRAEPVTISEVRTVQLHSAEDIVKMKRNQMLADAEDATSEPVSESESQTPQATGMGLDQGQATSGSVHKPCHSTGSCSSGPSSSKPVQFHPTPPRRRKKLQRSCSEDGPSLLNDRLLKNGKRWDSGKNHNVYLMLTL